MEAFTIICEMCAAKLKVRNASLVGQKLACPKCGSMLTVAAPEGWAPPPTPPNSSGDSSESDFEDIDAILKQQATGKQRSPQPKRATPNKSRQRPSSSTPKSAPPATEPAPILPDDNWTAASTKSTRKLIAIIASVVAAISLLVAAIFAFTANRNKPIDPPVVAVNDKALVDEANANEELNAEKPHPKPNSIESDKPALTKPAATEEPGKSNEESATVTKPNDSSAQDDSSTSTPEPIESVEIPAPPPQSKPTATEPPAAASPFDEVFDEILGSGENAVNGVQTNFDELSNALENAGTTISEINQFAAIKRRRVGVPKYFVRKNIPQRPPKNKNGLELPCAAVQYKNQSLTSIVAEIEQITGVPLAFDSEELKRIDFEFGGNIDQLLIKDSNTFKAVLRVVIGKLNDKTTLLYDGGIKTAIVTAGDSATPQNWTIDVPDLKGMPPSELAKMLRDLIAPGTWASEGNDYKIEITDGQLQATHLPLTLSKIEQFFDKWNIAVQNDDTAAQLRSTWSSGSKMLASKFESSIKYPMPIREFFADLQTKSGVCCLIDFESLSGEGWSPQATIPTDLDEANIGDLLDELCHSMKISYRAINENTFELLTTNAEKQRRDLEFYDCSKILKGPLDAEQMMQLLRQSVQSAGFTANEMRAYFAHEINCFVVVAPQSVQRKIESILKRLQDL